LLFLVFLFVQKSFFFLSLFFFCEQKQYTAPMATNANSNLFAPLNNTLTTRVELANLLMRRSAAHPNDTFFAPGANGSDDSQSVFTGQVVVALHTNYKHDVPQVIASSAGLTGRALGLESFSRTHQSLLEFMSPEEAEDYVCELVEERFRFCGEAAQAMNNRSTKLDGDFPAKVQGMANYPNVDTTTHFVGTPLRACLVRPTDSKNRVQTSVHRAMLSNAGLVTDSQHMIAMRPMTKASIADFIKLHMKVHFLRPGLHTAHHNRNVVATSILAGVYNVMLDRKTAFVSGLTTMLETTGLTLVPKAALPGGDNTWDNTRAARGINEDADFTGVGNVYALNARDDETNAAFRRLLYKTDAAGVKQQTATESWDIGAIVGAALQVYKEVDVPGVREAQRFDGHVGSLMRANTEDNPKPIASRTFSRTNDNVSQAVRQFNYDMERALCRGLLDDAAQEYDFGVLFNQGNYAGSIAKVQGDGGYEEADNASSYGRLLTSQHVNSKKGLYGFVALIQARMKNYAGLAAKTSNPGSVGAVVLSHVGRAV
jgi:hypothetical protein